MDDKTKETEFFKSITYHGATVTIIVCLMDENQWQLSIEGRAGQFTTWTDWYASSDIAMQRGMAAIVEEGIEEFYSRPEFDYAK